MKRVIDVAAMGSTIHSRYRVGADIRRRRRHRERQVRLDAPEYLLFLNRA